MPIHVQFHAARVTASFLVVDAQWSSVLLAVLYWFRPICQVDSFLTSTSG